MSFWKSITHKAKKKHLCEYCGKTIEVGETYSRETGMYGGDFNDYCLCQRCRSVVSYFINGFRDELGDFVEDVIDCDILECPKCGSILHREYEFADDMQSVSLECDRCDNEYTVDLSEEAFERFFEHKRQIKEALKERENSG